MTALRRLRLLVCLVVVAALGATAEAQARPALGFMDPTYAHTAPDRFWEDMAALRPGVLRYNLHWSDVAPTRPAAPRDPGDPAYRWGVFDSWMRAAAAHGVRPLVTFWYTPAWANKYRDVRGTHAVPGAAAWRDFVAAAARRYSGTWDPDGEGGEAPLPRVAHWEIWNEPNYYLYPVRRKGRLTLPRDYADMVNLAYAELHAVGRAEGFRPTVIAGAMARSHPRRTVLAPLNFLALLRRANARFDAISIHPYGYRPRLGVLDGAPRAGKGATVAPNIALGNFGLLPRTLDRLWPGRRVRIWVTEFGWEAHPKATANNVTPAQQARFLADAVRVLRRPSNRVDALVWFLLRDEPLRYPNGRRGWQSGLRYVGGGKKPAFDVWRRLAR